MTKRLYYFEGFPGGEQPVSARSSVTMSNGKETAGTPYANSKTITTREQSVYQRSYLESRRGEAGEQSTRSGSMVRARHYLHSRVSVEERVPFGVTSARGTGRDGSL